MRIENLELSRAQELAMEQEYAYITRLSSVYVGRRPDAFSLDELLEARFFGNDREIRIYQEEEGFAAVMLVEEPGDMFLKDTVSTRDPRFGQSLKLHRHIVYDEDGQASFGVSLLVGWEDGNDGQAE